MGKVAKLVMITGENNNKFYNMTEDPGGQTYTAKWGRIGVTETVTPDQPMSKWDSQYRSKLKKGYVDHTDLFVVDSTVVDFSNISDSAISRIVDRLQSYAKGSVAKNYTVSADSVTQKQVERAQELVDELSKYLKLKKKTEPVNKLLLDLYGVIPRRMSNVKLYLLDFDTISDKDKLEKVERLLSNEQDTLDVMRGQVQVNTAQKTVKADDKTTILEAMGIEVYQTIPDNVKEIKSLFTECGRHYKGSFKIVNKKTQGKFDKFLTSAKDKNRRLFWHGSRNENWWSIMDSGLVLRPTNAVINGKMFGYGVYFADKDRKSFNYTSFRGSHWARGTDSTAFMAVFDVHVGKQLHVKHHQSWCYELTEKNLKARGDYDSLFAEGGADLLNNEFIVYNDAQCTIKYLVEFGD